MLSRLMTNKVLILHTSANIGGAEYSLLEFLNNLKGYPIEIHIALSSQIKKLFEDRVDIPLYFHNINLCYFKKRQSLKSYLQYLVSLIQYNFKFLKIVKEFKINAVYCNTFRSLPYCFIVKFFSKTRVICHCRDNVPSKFVRDLIKQGCNQTIAVSGYIKNQISPNTSAYLRHCESCEERSSRSKPEIKKWIASPQATRNDDKEKKLRPIKIIYNGVNVSCFSDCKPTGWLRRELNLSQNIKLIGNIGQIVSWKNQTDFILIAKELIKENANLHFLLIGGSVDDKYFNSLKQQIDSFQLSSCFTLTGQVEDIQKYLCELDILIHTAIDEPFGRVIIEAGAASKPVIAYDSGGVSEIIKNWETGFLVSDGNIHQMVKCSGLLLDKQSLRKSMGSSAQKHIAVNFSSMDYARKVYNTLIYD